jgi:hypothetical protein
MAAPVPVPRPAPQGAPPAASSANRNVARPGPTPQQRAPGAPAAPPAATPKATKLGAVVSGPRRDPKLWWFYGDEGIGKSSLAADAPNPIFLDVEGRTRHLHVQRYPFRPEEGDEGTVARTLAEVEDAIDDLIANARQYGFRSAVLDGMAALEALIFARIVDEAKSRNERNKEGKAIENIEDFGYQRGQKVAAQMWRALIKRFEDLRFRAGLHVILLGHAQVTTFKNPGAEDYSRYTPRLDPLAAGVLLEKCDVVGLVTFDDRVTKAGKKAIGVLGTRVIRLEHSPVWSAKCSLPMPSTIDLASEAPWQPFAEALDALYSMSPEGLRELLAAELERLGDDFITADNRPVTAAAMQRAIAMAGDDTGQLHRFLTGLQQSTPKTEETAP